MSVTGKKSFTHHDNQIDSVLNRLHSGSRFVCYTDQSVKRGGVRPLDDDRVHNVLRNLTHPDEVHDELGSALAYSYVSSLFEISSLLVDSRDARNEDNVEVKAAIERGMRIIEALVCGEDSTKHENKEALDANYNRASYASTAYSFFDHLSRSIFVRDDGIHMRGNQVERKKLRSFVNYQWKQWCIKSEELAYTKGDMASLFTGGGGVHVLNACIKGYASICYVTISSEESRERQLDNTHASCSCKLYQSLKQTMSRKFWIRVSVSNAIEIVKSETSESVKLIVECLSPLFYACVLQARHESSQQQQNPETFQHKHGERQLLLREILWGCSSLLHVVKEESPSFYQIAYMIQYLSVSLGSYVGQVSITICPGNSIDERSSIDVAEFAYDWLRGISDTMRLMVSKQCVAYIVVVDALSTSMKTILRYILPRITSNMNVATLPFDLISVYSSLLETMSSLPRDKLLQMANPMVAFQLGTLALSLHDELELKILCNIVMSIFSCLESNGNSETVNVGILQSSELLWLGGILCSLGCTFLPRNSAYALNLKKLGLSLLKNAEMAVLCGGKNSDRTVDNIGDECGLIHILSRLLDCRSSSSSEFQSLIGIMSSSVSNIDEDSVLRYPWKRRPLSQSEQRAALLIGLSLLHISTSSVMSIGAFVTDDAFEFLRSLMTCHPRISSRAVPSIIDVVRTCIVHLHNAGKPSASDGQSMHESTSRLLLKAMKFISSSAVVSDPHAASITWTFLSSLTSDSVPPTVRSTVIRVLPDMCSSNKRLRTRIHEIVGKSLASRDPLIRTAAMATLSDLTKQDLIRDVEEIVAWIQLGLTDDEPAVSYFALVSLKYLVSNDDLEFDLVIRVLEKRLGINLSDVNSVLSVLGSDLLLEGFVMLLAEAGFEEEEDDDDEEQKGKESLRVSPQSVKAVSMLVELWLSDGRDHSESRARIQTHILKSLAGFNAQLLGLDAESIRAWSESDKSDDNVEEFAGKRRYDDIKQIALAGIQLATNQFAVAENFSAVEDANVVESVSSIITTLLSFEEDLHGSSLYRTAASEKTSKIKSDSRARVSKAALSSLPEYNMILQLYEDEPNASTATAVMSAMPANIEDSVSTDMVLSMLSELFNDIVCDRFTDPHLYAIQICALMECVEKLRMSVECAHDQEDLIRGIVEEIETWIDTNGEYAYVTLALFALSISPVTESRPELADGVRNIQNTILEGCDTQMFDTEEVKLLCLCLVAAKMSNSADGRVTDVVDRLIKFCEVTTQVDGQISFGVLFGMSALVNNLFQDGKHLNRLDASYTWRRKQVRRIFSLHLSLVNSCLTLPNSTITSLARCSEDGRLLPELLDECAQLEELFVEERSLQTMRGLMIGLGQSFSTFAALDPDLSKCILGVIEKLPWTSGKAFALSAAYKSCIEVGIIDQGHVLNEASRLSKYCADDDNDPCVGHVLYVLANLCQLLPVEEMENVVDIVKKSTQAIIEGGGRNISSDGKQMAIFSLVSLIGEIKGLSNNFGSAGIHGCIKKDNVVSTAKVLRDIALSEGEDSKTKNAASIGLGLMSGMKDSDKKVKQKSRDKSKYDHRVNFADLLQAKVDTMMFCIFQEISTSHSTLFATKYDQADRQAAVKKLSILLKSLEVIAFPGTFGGRLIEVVLSDSHQDETDLKKSCLGLLVAQLESRRRIGFDGRGFLDLYLRLSKMSPEGLYKLVGFMNVPIMITALPDVITQLPTSSGEELVLNLWTTCLYDLTHSLCAQSAIEFFSGLKSILVCSGTAERKRAVSPAVLRGIQKLLTSNFFRDMCQYAGPSPKKCALISDAEALWIAYTACINEVADSTAIGESDASKDNLFGMTTCSAVLKNKSKVLRKVEVYISRHQLDSSLRLMLVSLVALGPQFSTISDMKESILNMFDLMVVKGIDTLSLEVLAMKVSFWWESLSMNRDILNDPLLQVSNLPSFLLTQNLSFKIQTWPSDLIIQFFDCCIVDLPPKLVFLCWHCKISDDVANRTMRILSSSAQQNTIGSNTERPAHRKIHALACMKSIARLLNGGEP